MDSQLWGGILSVGEKTVLVRWYLLSANRRGLIEDPRINDSVRRRTRNVLLSLTRDQAQWTS